MVSTVIQLLRHCLTFRDMLDILLEDNQIMDTSLKFKDFIEVTWSGTNPYNSIMDNSIMDNHGGNNAIHL